MIADNLCNKGNVALLFLFLVVVVLAAMAILSDNGDITNTNGPAPFRTESEFPIASAEAIAALRAAVVEYMGVSPEWEEAHQFTDATVLTRSGAPVGAFTMVFGVSIPETRGFIFCAKEAPTEFAGPVEGLAFATLEDGTLYHVLPITKDNVLSVPKTCD